MSIVEAVVWALLILFALAFVVRVAIGTWQLIYKLAPLVVPLILMWLFMVANDIPIYDTYETEGNNADYIESVEDPGGRSGHRDEYHYDQILPSSSSRSKGF